MSEVQTTAEQQEVQTEIQKFANSKEIIAFLAQKFPKCFILEGECRPLKIGLFQDLAEALKDEPRVSKTQLRHALRQYTANWRYLHASKVGAVRVDLEGNDAGVLTQEHIDHASQQLQDSKAKAAERRAAERAANPEKFEKKRPHFKGKNKADNKAENKPVRKPAKAKPALNAVDLSQLQKGAQVKVKAAERTQNAIVLEVAKESARVQLSNGLVVDIAADRLFL